ncbi:MAG: RrF2 family transcriptional regulator, partial [Nitrospinota bacterium]
KGPGGGFRLVSPPREITLWQIVTAVEGGEPLSDCVGGLEGCSEANPCALHSRWKGVKAQLVRFLEETTLHDIRVAARHVGQLVDS